MSQSPEPRSRHRFRPGTTSSRAGDAWIADTQYFQRTAGLTETSRHELRVVWDGLTPDQRREAGYRVHIARADLDAAIKAGFFRV